LRNVSKLMVSDADVLIDIIKSALTVDSVPTKSCSCQLGLPSYTGRLVKWLFLMLLQKRLMDKKAEKATLVNKIDVKKNR